VDRHGKDRAGQPGLPLATAHVGVDALFDYPDGFADAFGVAARCVPMVQPEGAVTWCHLDVAQDRAACLADAFRRAACPHACPVDR